MAERTKRIVKAVQGATGSRALVTRGSKDRIALAKRWKDGRKHPGVRLSVRNEIYKSSRR